MAVETLAVAFSASSLVENSVTTVFTISSILVDSLTNVQVDSLTIRKDTAECVTQAFKISNFSRVNPIKCKAE